MTRRPVFQACSLLPSLEERLRGDYEIVTEPSPEVVAVVTSPRYGVTREQMDAMPALGAIVHFGVGYETTDVDYARARGIAVSNTPDVLTDCVADLAVGGLIDVLRRLSAADRFVRRGGWGRAPFPLAVKVTGRRVGILGLGRIGRAIAHRLEAFDCAISYHSRHQVPDVPYPYVASPAALASEVDVLVVATSGGPATAGLVSAEVLDALGPNGYLVNIARGSVVDEPALVAALTSGGIAGAALDVFADEPNVPAALCDLDSVVLLPHIASATTETREAMGDLAFRNLRQFMTDGTLVTPVP